MYDTYIDNNIIHNNLRLKNFMGCLNEKQVKPHRLILKQK